jgi:hypothetical protein
MSFYWLKAAVRVFGVDLVGHEDTVEESPFAAHAKALLERGPEWLNIGGEGFLADGRYLCSYDHSRVQGRRVTLVEVSGPSLYADGSVRETSSVIVGLLESIGSRFAAIGQQDVAHYLQRKYTVRREGVWRDDYLPELSQEQFHAFEQYLSEYINEMSKTADMDPNVLRYRQGCANVAFELLRNCTRDPRSSLLGVRISGQKGQS